MMRKEALVVLSTLSLLMAAKLNGPIFHVTGWFIGRIAISVVMLYCRVLHGEQEPSIFQNQEPEWASGLGLGLAQ